MRPVGPERLPIAGPVGAIETVLDQPREAAGDRFAVVCHPHPQFGGTLDNKVVHTLARTLNETGVPTLRFNFRGVGKSAGAYADGIGETDDALAVIDWGRSRWPAAQLWLAGFSFGGYVALRAAQQRDCSRLITVAPPVARFRFAGLAVPRCPWLIIQGDADDVVDFRAVQAWASSLEPAPRVVLLSGVDHFFHGRLHDLKETVLRELGVSQGS
jgi:alpha/beta superfamily hydrolase